MGIVVVALLGLFGIFAVGNGFSVLFIQDCAAVTFEGTRRVGGRAFLPQVTCLNEMEANAYDVPTVIAGWGLIALGVVAFTSFWWLPRLRARKAKKPKGPRSGIPRTPLTKMYTKEIVRQKNIYEPQMRNQLKDAGRNVPDRLLSAEAIAVMHCIAFECALLDVTPEFRGRNSRIQSSQFRDSIERPDYEWVLLASAAQLTGYSHRELWLELCKLRGGASTPLKRRVAERVFGPKNPPAPYLVGDGGALSSPELKTTKQSPLQLRPTGPGSIRKPIKSTIRNSDSGP